MSQILDAIKQADEKRKKTASAHLNHPYQYITNKSSNKKHRFLWLTLLAVLLIAIIVFLFYKPTTKLLASPTLSSMSQQQPIQPQAAITNTEIKSNNNTDIKKPIEEKEISEKEMEEKPLTNKNNTIKALPDLALEIPNEVSPTSQPAVDKLLTDIPAQPTKLNQQNSNKQANNSKRTDTTASTSSTSIKTNETIAAWKRNLSISAIFNHADQAKRFVLISGKKLHEGDAIPDRELQLIKIMDNGIIVSGEDGQTFIKTH